MYRKQKFDLNFDSSYFLRKHIEKKLTDAILKEYMFKLFITFSLLSFAAFNFLTTSPCALINCSSLTLLDIFLKTCRNVNFDG